MLQSFFEFDGWLLGPWGVLAGALLIVLLRAILPNDKRRLLKMPSQLVGALLLVVIVVAFMDQRPGPGGVRSLATLFFWFAAGRIVFLLVVEGLLNRRREDPVPAIFADVVQAIIYSAAVFVTLRSVGFDPASLLTTSALLTAVIGLSLQDTLGNIVAGLAIQWQKPFDVGDWIQFDKHVGRVLEINWRATKLATDDGVEVVVPNGPLAKNSILNFSKPTNRARRTFMVSVANAAQPRRVQQVLLDALRDVEKVLQDPPPMVVPSLFKDSGMEYAVSYYIDEFHRREALEGAVRERCWYALERAGMLAGVAPRISEQELLRITAQLARVDFIKVLPDSERTRLAERAQRRTYISGDTVIRQGDAGDELFLVEKGQVRVMAGDREVARLGPGDFFGEMSLLTGDTRRATVVAVGDMQTLVVNAQAFDDILRRTPAAVEEMSKVVAERQVGLEKARESNPDPAAPAIEARTKQLLSRIKNFFSLS